MTLDKIPFEREFDMFEEEINFDERVFYNKIKGYLNKDSRIKAHSGKGYTIYLTNQSRQNYIPHTIILARKGADKVKNPIGAVLIEKDHPLGEEIRKDLEKIIREKTN
jgi:hypothetical protein